MSISKTNKKNDDRKEVFLLQEKILVLERRLEGDKKNRELLNSRIMKTAVTLTHGSIWIRTFRYRFKTKIRKIYNKVAPYVFKRALHRIYKFFFGRVRQVDNTFFNEKGAPLVSIVSPYYNSSKTIRDTLDSVLAQTFRDFEYIIVDDGSRKEDTKILNKIKDDKVRVIYLKENIGKGSPAAARNYGIKEARGRYIICLDSDDTLEPAYTEKGVMTLETKPWISLFSSYTKTFGTTEEKWDYRTYDPRELIHNNMMITATMFRRSAWEQVGGYKEGIGYEDWEFWINLAENGHFGYVLPERLFNYRTAETSRYIEDNKNHKANIVKINSLHPEFMRLVKKSYNKHKRTDFRVNPGTAFINLAEKDLYTVLSAGKIPVLIAMPSMTFGGAETLILNFAKELSAYYDITFITGLESSHKWQYRFEEISERVYHLSNMFDSPAVRLEFVSNYVSTHNVTILHLVHTDCSHYMLEELKKRHPKLRIILTMFNSRVGHFPEIKSQHKFIDLLTSDNVLVAKEYKKLGIVEKKIRVIPNGIDTTNTFNPTLFDRKKNRLALGLSNDDVAVFFIGRLSPEKNPDVFIDVAKFFEKNDSYKKLKFFVVGDGPMRRKLHNGLKNTSNLEFLGYRSDIAQILSASDIFILPSSIEGFPLSILEAMAMDNVCISSAVGAVPDVLTDGKDGFVVEPGSKNAIIDSLCFLHDNPKNLQSMKEQSRSSVVELFSSEVLGKNYKKLYKDSQK